MFFSILYVGKPSVKVLVNQMEYNSEQIGNITVIRPPLDSHVDIYCDGYGFKEWIYKKRRIESRYSSFPDGVKNIASKIEMKQFSYSMVGFYTCKVEDRDDMIFFITPGIAISIFQKFNCNNSV